MTNAIPPTNGLATASAGVQRASQNVAKAAERVTVSFAAANNSVNRAEERNAKDTAREREAEPQERASVPAAPAPDLSEPIAAMIDLKMSAQAYKASLATVKVFDELQARTMDILT